MLSVVILNYRTPDLALACARSVTADVPEHHRGPEETMEVVFVDNGSGDRSAERIEAAVGDEATVVPQAENRGFAAGINAGMEVARGDVVVLLNADTELRPGALAALEGAVRAPGVGVVAPRLEHPDGRLQRNAYRRFPNLLTLFMGVCTPVGFAYDLLPDAVYHPHDLPDRDHARARDVAHVMGAALAIDRAAYVDAGPLDDGFFLYLEETEWQRRVAARGWRIRLEPEARVVHHVRGGDPEAAIVSPHYLASARRYFGDTRRVRLTLRLALAASRAAFAVLPGARARRLGERLAALEVA